MGTFEKMSYAGASMVSSRPSITATDPLSDILAVLGARAARRTRLEAAGQWALSFPALNRLKVVAVLRGNCWLTTPGRAPQHVCPGDVCLIGRTTYACASNPALSAEDGSALYDGPGRDVARLGGDDTVLIGGGLEFSSENAGFLLDMLPDFLLVSRGTEASSVVARILALLDGEIGRELMGSEIVTARLADVLLVEAIRVGAAGEDTAGTGWLGALADPRLGRALRAIHRDIARPWTVAGLAGIASMSRAAFAAAFARRVRQPPLAYVRAWRLALARAALLRPGASVAGVAASVGYASPSALGHAFRRTFGASPKSSSSIQFDRLNLRCRSIGGDLENEVVVSRR